MSQIYKSWNLFDYDLAINTKSLDYKNDGLAVELYNVDSSNHTLCTGSTLDDLFKIVSLDYTYTIDQFKQHVGEVVKISNFRTYDQGEWLNYLMLCTDNFEIFYHLIGSNGAFVKLSDVVFTSQPSFDYFIKDDKNILIMSSATDDMWVWNGVELPYEVLDAPKVTSTAIGLGRLFVTCSNMPYKLLYSDELDPSSWSMSAGEAGEISFTDDLGEVLSVFSLDNYIYAIRRNGIVKIYNYNSNSDSFSLSNLYVSTGNIYEKSICLCGDKIVFLSTSGLYTFDGLNCKKIYDNIDGIFSADNFSAMGVCLNNVYYLCAKTYGETEYNNAVIEIDLSRENVYKLHFGYKYDNLYVVNMQKNSIIGVITYDIDKQNANMPMCITKNADCKDNSDYFCFKTNNLVLADYSKIKCLSRIFLKSRYNCGLVVETDKKTKSFEICGTDSYQEININMLCKCFNLCFKGRGPVDISQVTICYSYNE